MYYVYMNVMDISNETSNWYYRNKIFKMSYFEFDHRELVSGLFLKLSET